MSERVRGLPGVFVHETAWIDAPVKIGEGTKVWHFVHVCRGAEIGRDCTLGHAVYVGPDVQIGDRCRIQNGANVFEGVYLESDVFIGPGAQFTNVRRPEPGVRADTLEPTIVRKGAVIGAGAVIRCGVEIGAGAFVGAGAVVTKDVPPGVTVVGNPVWPLP